MKGYAGLFITRFGIDLRIAGSWSGQLAQFDGRKGLPQIKFTVFAFEKLEEAVLRRVQDQPRRRFNRPKVEVGAMMIGLIGNQSPSDPRGCFLKCQAYSPGIRIYCNNFRAVFKACRLCAPQQRVPRLGIKRLPK